MPYPVTPPEPPAIIQLVPSPHLPSAAGESPIVRSHSNSATGSSGHIARKTDLQTRSATAADLGSPLSVGVLEATADSELISLVEVDSEDAAIAPEAVATDISTIIAERPGEQGGELSGAGTELESAPKISAESAEIQSWTAKDAGQDGWLLNRLLQLANTRDGTVSQAQEPQQVPETRQRSPVPAPRSQNNQTPATQQQEQPTRVNTSAGVIEVTSDRQEFDERRQIFTAEGNVIMRFQGGILDANRVQGNLLNFIAIAEGNASLTRGQQVFRGDRFVYNFVQNSGTIQNASGIVFSPTSGTDLTFETGTGGLTNPSPDRPLSDRLIENQPPQQITSPGGLTLEVGRGGLSNVGQINRVRFEAEQVEFYPRGWTATNVRLSNDPFSPPELELRADRAVFTQLSPLRDEIRLTNSRIFFDQGFSIPTFRRRIVIDRTPREAPIVQIRYDARERGGVYVERSFDIINTQQVQLSITPQFLIQRAITRQGGNIFHPGSWGSRLRFTANVSARTRVEASAVTPTFFLNELPDRLRASLRGSQIIGTRLPHTLTLEYSYRNRLFNGSLGFQTVRSSLGAVITSPVIRFGRTGLNLTYQGGVQYINAETDRADLIDFDPFNPEPQDNRVTLARFQASAELARPTLLWRGRPLPATASEGLRYTPVPVVPFLQLVPSVRGTTSAYTSGDTQQTLSGSIALQGQFGHFSRPFLDYTGFNVGYTQVLKDGLSPFFFDRVVDTRVLSFGITQQLYGPFRVGFQTGINLDTGERFSTDYFLEYSRRTYGIIIRFNPDREQGSINLRISDFNWTGGDEVFGGSGGRFVDTGVIQE